MEQLRHKVRPFIGSSFYRVIWNIKFLGPCRKSLRFTSKGNLPAAASITSLFFRSGPSYIAALIVSLVINSVHGMMHGRTRSDGLHKYSEVKEFWGQYDPPSAVIRKVFTRLAVASGFDSAPRIIFGGMSFSGCTAMLGICAHLDFAPEASA